MMKSMITELTRTDATLVRNVRGHRNRAAWEKFIAQYRTWRRASGPSQAAPDIDDLVPHLFLANS
jgi:hypothetical protein